MNEWYISKQCSSIFLSNNQIFFYNFFHISYRSRRPNAAEIIQIFERFDFLTVFYSISNRRLWCWSLHCCYYRGIFEFKFFGFQKFKLLCHIGDVQSLLGSQWRITWRCSWSCQWRLLFLLKIIEIDFLCFLYFRCFSSLNFWSFGTAHFCKFSLILEKFLNLFKRNA